jgi:hypothetical protein
MAHRSLIESWQTTWQEQQIEEELCRLLVAMKDSHSLVLALKRREPMA